MPISVSVSPLSNRLAVTPRPAGGFSRVSRPDPNDAMETYLRSHSAPVAGAHTSAAMPFAMLPPSVTGSGESALSANVGLVERARAQRQQYDRGEEDRRVAAGNTGIAAQSPLASMPMDRRFEALLQALYESGANKVTTGAARGWDAPGFFDDQGSGDQARQSRVDYLRNQDVTRLVDALRQQRGTR